MLAIERMVDDDLLSGIPECGMTICFKWAGNQQRGRGSCCRWAMAVVVLWVGCGLWWETVNLILWVRAVFSFDGGLLLGKLLKYLVLAFFATPGQLI